MNTVKYKTYLLAKNSRAYELWQAWQLSKLDKGAAQKVLDKHLAQVVQADKDLLTRYDK